MAERNHGEHGWFKSQEAVYAPLLKCSAVKNWADTLDSKNARPGRLYSLWLLLEDNKLGPEELLQQSASVIKQAFKHTILRLQGQKKHAMARRSYYGIRSFLEYNDKWDDHWFKRDEKKQLLNRGSLKRIGRQYVPSKEDIYRMADGSPTLRDKAVLLCLYQSGVRDGCLTNWKWRMFKNSLFPKQNGNGETPAPKYPIKIIVTPDEDSKISSYGVGYYVTFLNVEAGEALREYLLQRMRPKTIHIGRGEYTPGGRREYLSETEQLVPKDEDYVFVTEGTVSRGRKLSQVSIRDIVKRAAVKAAIEPETIWPHCFRKGFRKTLYAAGLADDMAEALMGHKLPGSRGNYFDYHDDDMIAKQYLMADFGRTTSSRIVRTEGAIASLQKRLLEVQEENQRTRAENQSLKKQVDEMAAPRAVSGELLAELRRDPQFMAELAKAIRKEVKE